nr:uncharacterized protein LOC129523596 isoform X1 [Gorilla gorilla gorilla]
MGAVGRWGTMGELTRSLDVLDPIREGRAEQVGHSSLVSGETLHLPNLHSGCSHSLEVSSLTCSTINLYSPFKAQLKCPLPQKPSTSPEGITEPHFQDEPTALHTMS